MESKATLALRDGTVVHGEGFGSPGRVVGELVFNTTMTGYQEAITDPSYRGQLLMFTYPLIGNYGVNADDLESDRAWADAVLCREWCRTPSHPKASGTLDDFLVDHGVPGMAGLDTRTLTVKTRVEGAMEAVLEVTEPGSSEAPASPEELLDHLEANRGVYGRNLVADVSPDEPERLPATADLAAAAERHVVLLDCGAKAHIASNLRAFADVTRVPWDTPADAILDLDPDGVFLSNGPGDPAHPEVLKGPVAAIGELVGQVPVFGICLGHQLLALAMGAETFKLKFGHRGANQPVQETATGKVYITSQNHGFAVDADAATDAGLEVTQRNVNDDSVEGLAVPDARAASVQYHPEANPGPLDTRHLFGTFKGWLEEDA